MAVVFSLTKQEGSVECFKKQKHEQVLLVLNRRQQVTAHKDMASCFFSCAGELQPQTCTAGDMFGELAPRDVWVSGQGIESSQRRHTKA